MEDKQFSVINFRQGYGQFPYIVVRLLQGIYMQIPIHFIPEGERGDPELQPGTHLNDVPHEVMQLSSEERIRKMHDQLMKLTERIKLKLKADMKNKVRLALVEKKDAVWFFDEDEPVFRTTIPRGGTLVDQQMKVIAMNSDHFLGEI